MSSENAPGAGAGPETPTAEALTGEANLGPDDAPGNPRPDEPRPPSTVPFLMLDMAWPALFPALDDAQLQAISEGVASALSATFGATLDARAAFGPGTPFRFLHVAVWGDRVPAGSTGDANRKTRVETLQLRDTPWESFQIGASIDTGTLMTLARQAFASFPRFFKFTSTDPVKYDDADIMIRSMELLISSAMDPEAFTMGSEIVVFTTRFGLCHPKLPATSLTVDLTDLVRAAGGPALRSRTIISDIAASFWENPLLWFAAQILKLVAQTGIVSKLLGDFGGFGARFARILPPDLPIPGTTKKFVFDYANSRLEANAVVLRANFEIAERTPALTVEGPATVTRLLLEKDRNPARTAVLTASYTVSTVDFTPTHHKWVLLGGPARITLGPDAPQFDPAFIVPDTWGTETFFIGCQAWDDAGNQANGYLFVDAGLVPPPPRLPRPPIPTKQSD
jgi:hypothetical protein